MRQVQKASTFYELLRWQKSHATVTNKALLNFRCKLSWIYQPVLCQRDKHIRHVWCLQEGTKFRRSHSKWSDWEKSSQIDWVLFVSLVLNSAFSKFIIVDTSNVLIILFYILHYRIDSGGESACNEALIQLHLRQRTDIKHNYLLNSILCVQTETERFQTIDWKIP